LAPRASRDVKDIGHCGPTVGSDFGLRQDPTQPTASPAQGVAIDETMVLCLEGVLLRGSERLRLPELDTMPV
jgi:hypothetical protein